MLISPGPIELIAVDGWEHLPSVHASPDPIIRSIPITKGSQHAGWVDGWMYFAVCTYAPSIVSMSNNDALWFHRCLYTQDKSVDQYCTYVHVTMKKRRVILWRQVRLFFRTCSDGLESTYRTTRLQKSTLSRRFPFSSYLERKQAILHT